MNSGHGIKAPADTPTKPTFYNGNSRESTYINTGKTSQPTGVSSTK